MSNVFMPTTSVPSFSSITSNLLPIFSPSRFARFAPTTHSFAASANQRPCTRHHGFVFSMPVTKFDPSGREKECCAHVPMRRRLVKEGAGCEMPFREVGAEARPAISLFCGGVSSMVTEVTKIGAKAMMLLCQKTDLILGRSDSGRYAP